MAQAPGNPQSNSTEPRGFSEHTRRSSSENAHEQGWGLNEDERRRTPTDRQHQGGADYEYGAQDFGDQPVDTSAAQPSSGMAKPVQSESENVSGKASRKRPARRKAA